ncbi:MAG: HAD hydrolase-like protein [Candidatus Lokiarchaeota archaeon]|nr:HAD hydrolase-like protein [Candidatus Lokiarchaeota archaeon]
MGKEKYKHPIIIIYDFDGVIINSKGADLAAYAQMIDEDINWNLNELKGLNPMDLIRRFEMGDNPEGTIQTVRAIFKKFADLIPNPFKRAKFLIKMGSSVRNIEYQRSDFIEGIPEVLKKVHNAGIIQGICTNSEGERLPNWLKAKNCEEYISGYTSRNDRHKYGIKPDPRAILHLVLMLKKKHNLGPIDRSLVYFCGDNVTDIWAAQNARIKSIAVLSGHGTNDELAFLNADYVLNSINDLFIIPEIAEYC